MKQIQRKIQRQTAVRNFTSNKLQQTHYKETCMTEWKPLLYLRVMIQEKGKSKKTDE